MDYKSSGYKVSDLVKLDIMLNEKQDALSFIVHKDVHIIGPNHKKNYIIPSDV